MTTPKASAKTSPAPGRFRFPDPPDHRPEDRPDKMTNFKRMSRTSNVYLLAEYLGNPETTLVAGEQYLSSEFTRNLAEVRYPDLLVAFGVDPAAYDDSNAYVIAEQGKPSDFVLEVASPSTWREDVGPKQADYAAIGVGEYWRFDETGRYGGRLYGARLVDGEYVAIEIAELPDGSLQGYSPALGLYLRWEGSGLAPYRSGPAGGLERGELAFHDPATGRRIATLADERARAAVAEAELSLEREARAAAEAELAAERARVRELEARLRNQNT